MLQQLSQEGHPASKITIFRRFSERPQQTISLWDKPGHWPWCEEVYVWRCIRLPTAFDYFWKFYENITFYSYKTIQLCLKLVREAFAANLHIKYTHTARCNRVFTRTSVLVTECCLVFEHMLNILYSNNVDSTLTALTMILLYLHLVADIEQVLWVGHCAETDEQWSCSTSFCRCPPLHCLSCTCHISFHCSYV